MVVLLIIKNSIISIELVQVKSKSVYNITYETSLESVAIQ